MDGVTKHHLSGEAPSRTTEDYPQFRRAVQVFRLQEGTLGGLRDQDQDRNTDQNPFAPTPLLRIDDALGEACSGFRIVLGEWHVERVRHSLVG